MRVRVASYLAVFIMIVILIISSAVSMVYNKKLIEQTSKIAEQNMRIITMDMDEEINAILGICDSLRDDADLQDLMRLEPRSNDQNYHKMQGISGVLRQRGYSNIAISSIFAIGLNKDVFDPLYQISPYKEIISEYNDLDKFIASGKYSAFSAPSTFPNKLVSSDDKEKPTITYFSQYLSDNDFKLLGYILINVKKDYLCKDVEQIGKQVFDFIYIVDNEGKIIYNMGQPSLNQQIIKDYAQQKVNDSEIRTLKGETYYIIRQSLGSYPEWKVIGGMTYEKVKKDSVVLLNIVFTIGIISIFVVTVLSFYLSRKVTEPILEINQAMAQFGKREWPARLEAKTEDELKNLVYGFNEMVEQFRVLLEQVRQEHEEKKVAEIKSLELKLELLQAQINPHFIHNTLNAMQYLALKRGANDIRDLIQSFNLLLRASMSVGKEFISVKEELKCVESYINIQSYRYDNVIKVNYLVDEGLEEVQIPKLILQPIVENALYHGIIAKDTAGTIEIKINNTENEIIFTVTDDGVGIKEEVLNCLIEEGGKLAYRGFNNIGLNNINTRLRLYYGESYNLKIKSELGKGTCVWFSIPKGKVMQGREPWRN